MASRTIFVNPKPEQIEAYKLAVEALEVLRQNLKVNEPISVAYQEAAKLLKEGTHSFIYTQILASELVSISERTSSLLTLQIAHWCCLV